MQKFKFTFGILLLIGGIFLILGGLYKSYLIFTAQADPPEVFQYQKTPTTNEILNKQSFPQREVPFSPQEMQEQIQNIVQEQLQTLIPSDTIPKILNLIAWSIFMGILFFGAGKIAGLGVRLMK
ncbi:MAG: hypothetical protein LR000_01910 [Candidatus Pacebacteria bacterium]|nr:hypothetical protein [Candidatus Paceibacterota bacterium]